MTANEEMDLGIAHIHQPRTGDDFASGLVFDDQGVKFDFAVFVGDQPHSGPDDRPAIDPEVCDIALVIAFVGIVEDSSPNGVGVPGN